MSEKLSTTSKSVSSWKNGRCTSGISLFNSICEKFNILINELISGEKINEEHYRKKLEENLFLIN